MFEKEEIVNLLKAGYSLSEIAKEKNEKYHKLYYWCKRNNITISRASNGKSKSTLFARRKNRKISNSDYEMIIDMYINRNLSGNEIAKILNVSAATFSASLRREGFAVKLKSGEFNRKEPLHSKNTLESLYRDMKLSTYEICKLLNYPHHGAVVEDMKYYNIPRRNYKDAGNNLYDKHPEKKELHRKQFYEGITGPKNVDITSIEKRFMEWAEARGIKYKLQFQIRKNWHRYDFLIEGTKVIVEMDGDFWHSLPEHVQRDKKYDDIAKKYGYNVVRIKESELMKNCNVFDEKLNALIKKEEA